MRRKDSAITNRVKHVTMMSRPGATDSTVHNDQELEYSPRGRTLAGRNQLFEAGYLADSLLGAEQQNQPGSKNSHHSTMKL